MKPLYFFKFLVNGHTFKSKILRFLEIELALINFDLKINIQVISSKFQM